MERRSLLKGLLGTLAGTAGMSAVTGCSGTDPLPPAATIGATGPATPSRATVRRSPTGPAPFDPAGFTERTTTALTPRGAVEVTYRFARAVPYVAHPVDADYQSLTVSVPVAVDGRPVDAAHAPILLANSIGGYLPYSVAAATGAGGGGEGPGGSRGPSVGAPPRPEGDPGDLPHRALAAGYVVVEPGARGRTLVGRDGTYYGTAPAAIVDLKAAVRYVRANTGLIPGNTDLIVTSGSSAGGALSALLGASGESALYAERLAALGAADAPDSVYASGVWCPIIDLEHADMAYEWCWGTNPMSDGQKVDPALSGDLRNAFAGYQASLGLTAPDGRPVTAATYHDHLVGTFLAPAATASLTARPRAERDAYLRQVGFIQFDGRTADFGWDQFVAHVGPRRKYVPAFDALDLSATENSLFGLGTRKARHFTTFSLRRASGDAAAELDGDLPATLNLMNPMYHLAQRSPARAEHWWVRVGTLDTDTSLTVVGNLTFALQALGDDVDSRMYWDAGHGANDDPDAFIAWIGKVTGYTA